MYNLPDIILIKVSLASPIKFSEPLTSHHVPCIIQQLCNNYTKLMINIIHDQSKVVNIMAICCLILCVFKGNKPFFFFLHVLELSLC